MADQVIGFWNDNIAEVEKFGVLPKIVSNGTTVKFYAKNGAGTALANVSKSYIKARIR